MMQCFSDSLLSRNSETLDVKSGVSDDRLGNKIQTFTYVCTFLQLKHIVIRRSLSE